MKKNRIVVLAWLCLMVCVSFVLAGEQANVVALPAPRTKGGMPLMQALKIRTSSRVFSQKKLSLQTLSDLLWAGFGISRADGKRTAPSARNMQEIDIYVAKADGLFRYNARENALELISSEDIREATGKQDFVKTAPVNLIYVADLAKTGKSGARTDSWVALDTGFIAENVYLFCASEGLATVVRGMFESEKLARLMKLKDDQKIILTQTIGYPK
jgi:SagB-type dehydrogenase family enzyme